MGDYMSFGGGVQSTAIAMLVLTRDERLLRTEWSRLKREDPAGFGTAVDFEARLHAAKEAHGHLGGLRTTPHLHRSRIPIGDVDFYRGQRAFSWDDECAGVCGV